MLLSASLLTTTVKETLWWDTPGGKVTEQRDQTTANCSLMLYGRDGSVIFEKDSRGKTAATAIGWSWQFPKGWKMPVAVQLGNVWLSNAGGSAIIQAVGHENSVSFEVDQPVEDLLRPADHILVKTNGGELVIDLNHTKMDGLLSQQRRCFDAIKQ